MPGPIVQDNGVMGKLRSWANQENSVFDPLYEQVARRVINETGMNTPETTLMGGELATPLVSIFKDKAAREASTETFKGITKSLPYRLQDALQEFANKYPRVAAHLRPSAGKDDSTALAYYQPKQMNKLTEPAEMAFTRQGVQYVNEPQDYETAHARAKRMVWHEGTHAAQHLGNSDFNHLYGYAQKLNPEDKASKGMRSLVTNPFEFTANEASEPPFTSRQHQQRYRKQFLHPVERNAIELLKAQATENPEDIASKWINRVLAVRRTGKLE